jgi:hypothetical protein
LVEPAEAAVDEAETQAQVKARGTMLGSDGDARRVQFLNCVNPRANTQNAPGVRAGAAVRARCSGRISRPTAGSTPMSYDAVVVSLILRYSPALSGMVDTRSKNDASLSRVVQIVAGKQCGRCMIDVVIA